MMLIPLDISTFVLVMETTVHKEIEKKLVRMKKGQLIFLSDFRGIGSEAAIKMALSRLVKTGKIKRVAHGIYLIPVSDPVLGQLMPSMENIAQAVAKKEHVRIRPAGAYAVHKLGLTTQVPTRLVYITDGEPRQIHIGRTTIKFKPTSHKKLAMQGKLSSLIIQALEELGTDVDEKTKHKLKLLLQKEDPKILMADIKLAPVKISDFLVALMKEETHD